MDEMPSSITKLAEHYVDAMLDAIADWVLTKKAEFAEGLTQEWVAEHERHRPPRQSTREAYG